MKTTTTIPSGDSPWHLPFTSWSWGDFCQTLGMIAVAEAFDKTWFVALLMAMRFNRKAVFVGSCLALAAHTIIAAAIGYTISRFITVTMLNFSAAGLYAVLAVLFAIEWCRLESGSDLIEAGRAEASEAMGREVEVAPDGPGSNVAPGETEAGCAQVGEAMEVEVGNGDSAQAGCRRRNWTHFYSPMTRTFVAVFVAEWGDRTQIAMIGQHASQMLMPVVFGSLIAFFGLSFSAVVAARILGNRRLSEAAVRAISAVSFAAFALLALYDGFESQRREEDAGPILLKAG